MLVLQYGLLNVHMCSKIYLNNWSIRFTSMFFYHVLITQTHPAVSCALLLSAFASQKKLKREGKEKDRLQLSTSSLIQMEGNACQWMGIERLDGQFIVKQITRWRVPSYHPRRRIPRHILSLLSSCNAWQCAGPSTAAIMWSHCTLLWGWGFFCGSCWSHQEVP